MTPPTDELYIVALSKNSSAVLGPADLTEGACFGREEICRCTGWHHQEKAAKIAELLNEATKESK